MWRSLWRVIAWIAGHWDATMESQCEGPTCEGPDLDD
jgi:hypothetical protein